MDNTTISDNSSLVFFKTDLPFPPTAMDCIGLVVLSVMTFLSNAGGLAGGGILIPLMMIFFRISIFECVPLANVFGLIASTTRFITNYKQRHPNKKWQVTIDYELVQLAMPTLYLGTLIGVKIGTVLDEVYIAILLEIVLIFVTVKTAQKAKEMTKKEKQAQQKKHMLEMQNVSHGLLDSQKQTQHLISEENPVEKKQIQYTKELKEILLNEEKHFPFLRTLNFALTLVFLFVTSMLLGNKYQKERLVHPIIAYIALGTFIIYTCISSVYNARILRHKHQIKKRDGYQYDPTDLTFDNNKELFKVVIISLIAGCLGGIVGIAGGIILGPILLQMGMLPILVAGTNQYLAMISSLSVSTQFMYMGVLNYEYAVILGTFVMITAYLGTTQVNRIIKITGRQSIIVIILAFVLFVSSVSLPLKYLIQ